MSSKKSYNKGLETGIRLSEDIIKREAQAMEYLKQKMDSIDLKQDDIRKTVNDILEYQSNIAIEQYYGVCNAQNPKDLEDAEKHVLLDVLATLTFSNDPNRFQKMYFANLRHYLGVIGYQPNTAYNYEYIENIRDLDSQEIILKCIREYGFLKNMDFSFVNEYEDLLDCFSIKDKRIRQIDDMIDITYYLFGEMGIVQIYGDHVFISEEKNQINKANICLERVVLSDKLYIPQGEEKVFENKAVFIRGDIECYGALIFKQCQIYYFEENTMNQIWMQYDSSIKLDSCVIRSYVAENHKYLVNGFVFRMKIVNCIFEEAVRFALLGNESTLVIKNSEIINCCWLFSDNRSSSIARIHEIEKETKSEISKCFIECKKLPEYVKKESTFGRGSLLEVSADVIDCVIEGCETFVFNEENTVGAYSYKDILKIIMSVRTISHCNFKNVDLPILADKIYGCVFENCNNVIEASRSYRRESYLIEECLFYKCKNIVYTGENTCVKSCQFSDCIGNLIYVEDGSKILECHFYNIIVENEYKFGSAGATAISIWANAKGNSSIEKCRFDGINVNKGFLIAVDSAKKIPEQIATMYSCTLENASTLRESGSIIKRKYSFRDMFKKRHTEFGLNVINCKGFFEKFSQIDMESKKYILKEIDAMGDKIGIHGMIERGVSGEITNIVYSELVR